jgi:hypothetical protein
VKLTTQSNADVKNAWSYTSTPQYAFMAWFSVKEHGRLYLYLYIGVDLYFQSPNTPSWRGAQLKHRDNFNFTYSRE